MANFSPGDSKRLKKDDDYDLITGLTSQGKLYLNKHFIQKQIAEQY